MWRPLGPVVVFGASNFPLAYSVAGGDTASAFAAGNPVIVKAHPAHPGTSELVGAVILAAARACKMPEGIFSLLFDSGTEVGSALVKHPLVRAVGFTGLACSAAVRSVDEFGGGAARSDSRVRRNGQHKSSFYFARSAGGARQNKLREGLHGSVTLGAGQFCTKPGMVFLPAGEHAKNFSQNLSKRIGESGSQVMLTPGYSGHIIPGRSGARAKNRKVSLSAEAENPQPAR